MNDLPSIIKADYVAEARTREALPAEDAPEIAISGRSNVGKSTLLNRLAGRKSLARTSKTPGRTRGIIFYDLVARRPGSTADIPLRLVDLPGYGYAQVSRSERKTWGPLIEGYVERRGTLKLFLVLVDARRGLEEEEAQLAEWLASLGVPFRVVLTKADKLPRADLARAVSTCHATLGKAAPPPMLASGQTGLGVDDLWALMLASMQPAAPG
jgi:GTP-binding protein